MENFVVSARKYRPDVFSSVIGQENITRTLKNSIINKQIAHAYLFCGPRGVGKTTCARIFAKIINCITPTADNEPCNECESCTAFNRAGSFNIHELDAASNNSVEDIRSLIEKVRIPPQIGHYSVYIIDEVHMLSANAFNAFLKTLEEPPPQSIIILISASPDRLPETIRSRCSRINFSPLSPEQCKKVIKIIDNHDREISDSQLSTLSRLSMGRPGLAISSDLMEERDWFFNLFGEMSGGRNKETWADKEEMELWFNKAFMLLRDIAVLKITGKSDMLINTDLKDRFAEMSRAVEMKDIIDIYGRLSFLKGYLGFNLNKSITWNYVTVIMQTLKLKGLHNF